MFISAILFLTAGGCVFLLFLNRISSRFRDGTLKSCIVVIMGFVLTVGSTFFGYIVGFSLWTLMPILILVGIITGEIHRAIIRFSYLLSTGYLHCGCYGNDWVILPTTQGFVELF